MSIENASSAVATLKFPAFRPITVTLKVTDSGGRQSTATEVVNSRVYPSSGTGGGGALGLPDLAALAAGSLIAFLRRRKPSAAMLRGRPGPQASRRPYPIVQES